MAKEQIRIDQISATGTPGSGNFLRGDGSWTAPASSAPGKATQIISLSGGSADKTTSAFGFVVGLVLIEVVGDNDNNGNTVLSLLWVNLRSYSGTKTADITDRMARGVASDQGIAWCNVDRTSSGTVVTVSQITTGTLGTNPDGTGGISSMTLWNWPSNARLRITAWEDTES